MNDLLWPTYDGPRHLAAIEEVALTDRGLPGTTYDLLVRAARLWPDRVALSVLPDGERWEQPTERTFAELLADVHRYANAFHALDVRRTDGVACWLRTVTSSSPRPSRPSSPASPRRSTVACRAAHRRTAAQVGRAGPRRCRPRPRTRGLDQGPGDRPRGRHRDAARPVSDRGRRGGAGLPPLDGVRVGHLSALAAEQPHECFVGEPPSATDLAALFHTGGTTARRSSRRTPTPTRSPTPG
ncbi:hypothetical protein [Nocardioides ungokensis]|uniref:hypothetical protein n=1 Tax=Nocardioides ungokensis TaxID=1643322 RepID=UPI001FE96312|nr:hypothetical protein [Nocardioides ungokensis]